MSSEHKMSRHEMKQNDLVTVVDHARAFVEKNPAQVRNIAIAAVVVLALGFGGWTYLQGRRAAARSLMATALERLEAPVLAAGTAPPAGATLTYATAEERDRAALESFNELSARYGGSPEGRLAVYHKGILLAHLGRTDEAESALTAFLPTAPTPMLAALAKSQLAQVLAQKGDLDGAAKLFGQLAEDTTGAYPRDWALYYMAQTLQKQGKGTEAQAAFARIVKEYPTSYFAGEASKRASGA